MATYGHAAHGTVQHPPFPFLVCVVLSLAMRDCRVFSGGDSAATSRSSVLCWAVLLTLEQPHFPALPRHFSKKRARKNAGYGPP